ncbi:unnamed protein product [Arabis nemorensis]|uniref:Uncharacterized protein n=1 Tax=Arabis nemorensis TaxID=586526 RepID=A0A565AL41_9BRAS|nr:unnamed protein product [Arabis nemorensis]
MGPICDVVNENKMDFWVEADLISSDVESNFHACVQENANPGKECHGFVSTEDDSIFENLGAMLMSDIHSHAALNPECILRICWAMAKVVRRCLSLKGEETAKHERGFN